MALPPRVPLTKDVDVVAWMRGEGLQADLIERVKGSLSGEVLLSEQDRISLGKLLREVMGIAPMDAFAIASKVYPTASGPPPAQPSGLPTPAAAAAVAVQGFEPRSESEDKEASPFCFQNPWLEPVFRRVKWLTVKAYTALGDCIAASPGQVLAQLQKQGEPRVFFGALVIWVHKRRETRRRTLKEGTDQQPQLKSQWLVEALRSVALLEHEALLLVPHSLFESRLRSCTDKASAPATWPYLEADAWAVYYEWDRRPLRALVAEKLNAITTLCGVHIGEHEKLDDVNLLHRQCDDRLWQKLLIYRCDDTAAGVFSSRRAAAVEASMKKAWTTHGMSYQQLASAIRVLVDINQTSRGEEALLQRVQNKYLKTPIAASTATLSSGSSYLYDVVRRWENITVAGAATPDEALEVKWDNLLWVHVLDACFDQVAKELTLHRREKKSLSTSAMHDGAIRKVDAIGTGRARQQPEILYVESQLPGDQKHTTEDRYKLFKLMQAELIWRITSKINATLVLGVLTQGPDMQIYLMDLCTYDSFMIVKVADLSLYQANKPHLASFLDAAVHVLTMRHLIIDVAERYKSLSSVSTVAYMQMLCVVDGICPSTSASPLDISVENITQRLCTTRDSMHGEVFVKREHNQARAEAELSALVRLRGIPGVAPLLHTEIQAGDRLFVFPVLKQWKPHMHAQSLDHVRQFCRQLFETLAQMHELGIAHRDLHPGNLLYNRSADRVVITDFGLAAYCVAGHFFGGVGTDGFRAPEVVAGVASTAACDVFSAGVLLALVLREFAPSGFHPLAETLGEQDLSCDDIDELRFGLAHDETLPWEAKHLLVALLEPLPEKRLAANQVRNSAFLSGELPATPATSRKRLHPPSPSSPNSPETVGE